MLISGAGRGDTIVAGRPDSVRVSKPVWVAALGVGAGLLWLLVAPFIFLVVGLAYVYIRIFVRVCELSVWRGMVA